MRIYAMVFVVCLILFSSNASAKRLQLGVLPFEVVGDVPTAAGRELAAFISPVLKKRYNLKERMRVKAIFKEGLFQESLIESGNVGKKMREQGVDLLLLGQVSRTVGDYSIVVRVCDLSGNVRPLCGPVQSSSWEGVKAKLASELEKYVNRPSRVRLCIVSDKGEKVRTPLYLEKDGARYDIDGDVLLLPGRYRVRLDSKDYRVKTPWLTIEGSDDLQEIAIAVSRSEVVEVEISVVEGKKARDLPIFLEKDGKSYRVDHEGSVPPGRYRVKIEDGKYRCETPQIEIIAGDKLQKIEIRVKGKGIDLHLVLGYGGAGAMLLGILYCLLRIWRKKLGKAKPVKDDSWRHLLELAGRMRGDCKFLCEEESLADFKRELLSLSQCVDAALARMENTPTARRQEKRYHFEKAIEELRSEIAQVKGLAQGASHERVGEKISEMRRRAESI